MIYPPVHIQPPTIILPWPVKTDHSGGTKHSDGFQVRATGGSGHLAWVALPDLHSSSSTMKKQQPDPVITVTSTGKVSARAFGDATIVAFSPTYPQLCGSAKVIVTSPASIRFVLGPAEVVIVNQPHHGVPDPIKSLSHGIDNTTSADASVLTVGIAVLDQQGRAMTDCRHLNIPVRPLDPSIVTVLPGLLSSSREVCVYHDVLNVSAYVYLFTDSLGGKYGSLVPLQNIKDFFFEREFSH